MGAKDHSRKTREVAGQLKAEGWYEARKGPGDHVQFRHPKKPGRVTLDMGEKEIPTGTLRSIFRQAGWSW